MRSLILCCSIGLLTLSFFSCDVHRSYSYAYGSGSGGGSGSGSGRTYRTVSNPNFNGTTNMVVISGRAQDLDDISSNFDKKGILTAAELNDLSKWELWKDIDSSLLSTHQKTWGFHLEKRFTVLAYNATKCPVTHLRVELLQNGTKIWETYTDNKGLAQLWETSLIEGGLQIKCYSGDQLVSTIDNPKEFEAGINKVQVDQSVTAQDEIEIAFVVDATGSMEDEIDFLKEDLMSIVSEVQSKFEGDKIRLGSVFYQCEGSGNDYVTVKSDLSENIQKTLDFIKSKQANGGGEEVVEMALDKAINDLKWNPDSRAKMIFILLDEPPKNTPEVAKKMAEVYQQAAAKGIRIVPCVTSNGYDNARSLEYLMRTGAMATNGTLLFLTDDSGVGGQHIIPFTDHYEVELFKDVLSRVIVGYCEKSKCDTPAPQTPQTLTENNTKLLVDEVLDSLALSGSDSTVAATLLPFTTFASVGELLENKPLRDVDTTALLGHFGEMPIELVVFPNPAMGDLTLSATGPMTSYELLDGNGRILVHEAVLVSKEVRLNLSDYPVGTYTIRCYFEKRMISTKVQRI